MKRRYWRRDKSGSAGGWIIWLACAGLVACYAYGAIVLVPRGEPFVAPAGAITPAPRGPEEVSRSETNAIGTIERPQAYPATIAAESASGAAAGEHLRAISNPDPCVAAMAAALSNARIEFLSASTEIVPASRNVISVLAALAHACPGQIAIAGHSDNQGSEPDNVQLSLDRAESVASAFIEFGLEAERLSVRGFGSSRPIADNSTSDGRARNRRIEMTLTE